MRTDPCRPSRNEHDWEAQKWANQAEPIEAAPRLETTISVRFDPDAARLLRRAARLSGLTKSEFVRRATIAAAKHKIAETPPPVSARPISPTSAAPITGSGRSRTIPLGESSRAAGGQAATGSAVRRTLQ